MAHPHSLQQPPLSGALHHEVLLEILKYVKEIAKNSEML
jgi:hypothetical protein